MTNDELVEIKRRLTAVEAEIDNINTAIELEAVIPPEPPIIEPPVPPIITVPPEPPAAADKYPKRPPTSGVVHRVPEDFPNVLAALDVAKPGETVSVAPGFKCGELVVTKSFDPTNPVILRSRTTGGAEFDKRVRLRGQGYWVHGFKSTFKDTTVGGDGAITLDADFINLTKLEIQSPYGIVSRSSNNRRGINVGWCLFNGQNPTGASVHNIYFDMPDGGNASKASDAPRNIHIYRNDFHDPAKRPSGVEDCCVYFGKTKPKGSDLLALEDVELYQNLVRADNERTRGFYMKRGCRIIQNSFLGRGYNWGIRHGGDSVIEGNTSSGSYKLVLNGPGSRVLGNLAKSIMLYAGSEPAPFYQAADRAFLDSNTGPVLVGYISKNLSQAEGGRCGNVLICNHSGTITINDAGTERSSYRYDAKAQGTYLPRLPLTVNDVGLLG